MYTHGTDVNVTGTVSSDPPSRRKRRAPGTPRALAGWLFISPNLLGVLLFTLVPLASVIALAFTGWNLVSGFKGIKFVGLDNFLYAIQDPSFWQALLLTMVYALGTVPLAVLFGLLLAMALNRDVPGRGALRASFFIPYIVNIVAIGLTWSLLLDPEAGMFNQFLTSVGMEDLPGWLASSRWALPGLILITIWSQVGYACLIYLSSLQDQPIDLHEAAQLDGASRWARFRLITWPAILPTTIFLMITIFVGVSQSFGLIALLTNGGPGASTTTLSFYIYQTSFQFYRFGYASAIGLIMFIGLFALMGLLLLSQRGRSLHD